jgi:hypothetical protein
MVDVHVCQCEGACTCGRPKPRPGVMDLTAKRIRLAQLEQGMFEGGAAQPSENDIALLTDRGMSGRAAGQAGELLSAWARKGWVPGLAPQRGRVA